MSDLADQFIDQATSTHNTSFERIVLGAMLSAPAVAAEVQDLGLDGEHFYNPRHAALYRAILAAQAAKVPIEPIALAAWLADRRELEAVGGGPYLLELVQAVPLAGSAAYYAQQLIGLAEKRTMLTALARVAQAGAQGATGEQLHGFAENALREAAPKARDTGFTFLGAFAEIGLRDIEMRKQQARGIPTGFADLDRLLGGLRAGQLIVVAGRPGMGKSTLGLDIARHVSIRCGLTTAYVSLEMTIQELFDRCLSAQARIPYHVVRDGGLSEDDWIRASRALGPMAEAPLGFTDETGLTVTRIANKLRRQARQGLDLAVIDHLGLVRDPSVARQGRQAEIAQITRDLKELAKDLAIPIVALVQLNREVTNRSDKTPQLTDLRESGEIEQSADTVILVHRDDYYIKDSPRAGEADLIVAKHRGGPTDTITVAAQLHLSRFIDMAIQS